MKFLNDIWDGMKLFGETISAVVNFLLLSFVYLIGVGLTSIAAKLFGKHFIETKQKKTYWEELNLTNKKMEEYYRQF